MKLITRYSLDFTQKVLDYMLDKLLEMDYDGFSIDSYDLHNEVFNTDYVVYGCYEAKEQIAENIHDLFAALQHEKEDFGENHNDFEDVERILNTMYYMCGLEIFNELNIYDINDGGIIEREDLQSLIKFIEEEVTV